MLKELELLKSSKIVKNYEVMDFKDGENFYFLKIKAVFIDNSILHIKEFNSTERYIYSFHWQDEKGNLIIRWDNAPHHKHLKTFPHHKHIKNKVEESDVVDLSDVLNYIEKNIF